MRGFATALSLGIIFLPALSLAETSQTTDPHPEARAALLGNRLGEAIAAYREFLSSADTGKAADVPILEALSGLGTALMLREQPGEAKVHLRRALRIQRHLVPDHDLLAAELLHGLARVALIENLFSQAFWLLGQELQLRTPYAEQQPETVARTLRELARVSHRRGKRHAPRNVTDRELELYEQALMEGRINVPLSMQQLSRDSIGAGRAFRLHFLRATAVSSEPVWHNDATLAEALRGMAAIYAGDGDTLESLRWFERAWLVRAPKPFKDGLEAYAVYPNQKALAMALDARGRWTFGFFTGEATQQDAVDRALRECRRRLPRLAIEADCRIYALNAETVWEPSSIVHER